MLIIKFQKVQIKLTKMANSFENPFGYKVRRKIILETDLWHS